MLLFISMLHAIHTLLFFYTIWTSFSAIITLFIYVCISCLLHLQLFICFSYENDLLFIRTKSGFLASSQNWQQQGFTMEALTRTNNSNLVRCYNMSINTEVWWLQYSFQSRLFWNSLKKSDSIVQYSYNCVWLH